MAQNQALTSFAVRVGRLEKRLNDLRIDPEFPDQEPVFVLTIAHLIPALGILVAARLLDPFPSLLLSPIIVGAAMSLSSVSAINNAPCLSRVKL